MIREGQELAKINPKNIVIKVPMTGEGLKATRIFTAEGIKTNVTLVFSPLQALLAAKAGRQLRLPFCRPARRRRPRRHGRDRPDPHHLRQLRLRKPRSSSPRCAPPCMSCRRPLIGADICTIPFSVMPQLDKHPLTDVGINKFLADWGKNEI